MRSIIILAMLGLCASPLFSQTNDAVIVDGTGILNLQLGLTFKFTPIPPGPELVPNPSSATVTITAETQTVTFGFAPRQYVVKGKVSPVPPDKRLHIGTGYTVVGDDGSFNFKTTAGTYILVAKYADGTTASNTINVAYNTVPRDELTGGYLPLDASFGLGPVILIIEGTNGQPVTVQIDKVQ